MQSARFCETVTLIHGIGRTSLLVLSPLLYHTKTTAPAHPPAKNPPSFLLPIESPDTSEPLYKYYSIEHSGASYSSSTSQLPVHHPLTLLLSFAYKYSPLLRSLTLQHARSARRVCRAFRCGAFGQGPYSTSKTEGKFDDYGVEENTGCAAPRPD